MTTRFVQVIGKCNLWPDNPRKVCYFAVWNWESEALRLFDTIESVSVVD